MTVATANRVQSNLSREALVKAALEGREGVLSTNGALSVETGSRTGRSPKDRFIVNDALTADTVHWGDVNQPISTEKFEALWERASAYISDKTCYQSDLQVGADPKYGLPLNVTTEYAWHQLFANHLFIRPEAGKQLDKPVWEILNVPGFTSIPERDGTNSDGAVMINLTARRVLLCGMRYAGEMKKSIFTVMNYFMPAADVLPMHCAANVGDQEDAALFFGLSGTGKTTLSADPARHLIGDDEHGWGREGVFNFEGGCYAKCINLSQEREPVIWSAIREHAVMENVVLTAEGAPDYNDATLTQNSRAAYPRDFIPNCVPENRGPTPKAVLFLTCDLYGVLPPVALLNKEQAAYYFLSGYTALVGSTEVGSTSAVQPTFSTCFGAPFFPRHPTVYANLLMKRVEETGAKVYLINTGWTGGAYGEGGSRFSIPVTRKIVAAAVSGELLSETWENLPDFDLQIPTAMDGVDSVLLDPRKGWSDQTAYQVKAQLLIADFKENYKRFE